MVELLYVPTTPLWTETLASSSLSFVRSRHFDRGGFRSYLPLDFGEGEGYLGDAGGDEGVVRLSLFDHDLGGNIMGEEFRRVMMDLGSRGECKSDFLPSIVSDKIARLMFLGSGFADIEEEKLRGFENVHRRKNASVNGLLRSSSFLRLTAPLLMFCRGVLAGFSR